MRLYRARALSSMWRNSALSSSRVNSPLHISTSPSTSTVSTPEDRAVEDVVDGVHTSVPRGRRYAWKTMSARLPTSIDPTRSATPCPRPPKRPSPVNLGVNDICTN